MEFAVVSGLRRQPVVSVGAPPQNLVGRECDLAFSPRQKASSSLDRYSFHGRHHFRNWQETVLYAIPL